MSERCKYSLNGLYRCENFSQHVENDDFPITHIGRAAGIQWFCVTFIVGLSYSFRYIQFRKKVRDGLAVAAPIIYHQDTPKTQVRAHFTFLKNDGSSGWKLEINYYLGSNEVCVGKYVDIAELLNENNGYLDDGAITVEYGFQVDSVEGDDGIWRFNFWDKFFDWKTKDEMFQLTIFKKGSIFSHRQFTKRPLTEYGNRNSASVPCFYSLKELITCLQITHGVRLKLTAEQYVETMSVADYCGFSNTIIYCEQKLIEIDEQPELEVRNFQIANCFYLRRYLNHLLNQIRCREQLVNVLKKWDIEDMSSKSMKAFVEKLFNLV